MATGFLVFENLKNSKYLVVHFLDNSCIGI